MASMSDTKMSHAEAVARITDPALKNRPLLLPNVKTFGELFSYVREWDHETMTSRRGVVSRPDLVPAPRMIGENELGPFCEFSVNRRFLGRRLMAVTATDAVVDAITPRIVTPDDHLSFEILEHETGWALVTAQHGYIIGSHWLAYIDPATIPTAE